MTNRAGLLLALSVFLGPFLSACGDGGPPPLADITVTPAQVSFSFLGETRTIPATITDETGAIRTDVELSWSSNAPSVASVSPTGLVSAVGNGTATVQASAGGVTSNPVTVTVSQAVESIEVTGGDQSFSFLGQSAQLTATARDQGGAEVTAPDLTWTSTNPAVASVSAAGLVEAVGNGTATIRARADGASSNGISVLVQQVAEEVSITGPGSVSFSSLGETAQLEVEARDAGGSAIQDPTTSWTSSDESVVTVDQSGTVEAVGNGSAEVTARVDDATSGPLSVTVEQEAVAVVVDPTRLTIDEVGGTGQLTATALDAGSNPVAGAEFTWESSDEGIATVEASGSTVTVTGVAEGTAEITARSGGVAGDPAAVGVGGPPVPRLEIGERVTGLSAELGEQLFYKVTISGGTGELIVGIGNGNENQDADLFVRHGELPTRDDFDCVDGNQFADEICEIPNPAVGEWFILIDAFTEFSDLDLLALTRTGAPTLTIDVEYVGNVSDDVRNAVEAARARWERAMPSDVVGFWITFEGTCRQIPFNVDGPVEDYHLQVEEVAIDGPSNVLARAGWCFRRVGGSQDNLPVAGLMQIDQDDVSAMVAAGNLVETALHEIGHAVGFSPDLWSLNSPVLIQDDGTGDPIFVGERALAAFDEVGGTEFSGNKVPLEAESQGHWRESVFDNELMTPFSEGSGAEPLSIVTIQAMADLGWTVDLSEADAYTLPGSSGAAQARDDSEAMPLVDDIPRLGKVYTIDTRGRIRVIRDVQR